jgi:hypothetical protein
MNVSGQMIQLGNPQDRLLLPAMLQGFQQLWPLCAFFAGLNFHDFCEDCLLVTETSLDTEARWASTPHLLSPCFWVETRT